jgi:hypothetical protein
MDLTKKESIFILKGKFKNIKRFNAKKELEN